jgi:hypothetical protein
MKVNAALLFYRTDLQRSARDVPRARGRKTTWVIADVMHIYCYEFLCVCVCVYFANIGLYWREKWESPKERDHWENQGVGGKMGSELILGRLAWGVWIGFDSLRTGTGGGLL